MGDMNCQSSKAVLLDACIYGDSQSRILKKQPYVLFGDRVVGVASVDVTANVKVATKQASGESDCVGNAEAGSVGWNCSCDDKDII